MILIDFSQLAISTALDFYTKEPQPLNPNLNRHIILNTLFSLKKRLKEYSEEIVLCIDSRENYWRKNIFPEYKAHRKKDRNDSKFDWEEFFKIFDTIKQEFKDNMPFKCLEIPTAEADDIISILSKEYGKEKDIVIVSSDKDFLQLQSPDNKVKQYSNYHKDFLTLEKGYDLFEHIIKGDSSDGIPNIFSDDDTFLVESKRQVPVRKTNIEKWKEFQNTPEYFCDNVEVLRRYERNKQLIDLTLIPDDLGKTILEVYKNTKIEKQNYFSYLAKHGLVKIMEQSC